MKKIVLFFIVIYQRSLSPDHGWFRARYPHGFCRYYPSCSEYTKLSVEKYGVFRGFWMGGYRILRCNPFSKGGVDVVK